jgi:GrpB-like predicted nucleotidyltransferase (UPF0157 family)
MAGRAGRAHRLHIGSRPGSQADHRHDGAGAQPDGGGAFRDALRHRADYRSRYEQLKRDLAQAHGTDLIAYAREKDDVVNEVLGVRHKTEPPPASDPRRP